MFDAPKVVANLKGSVRPGQHTKTSVMDSLEYQKRTRATINAQVTPVGVVRGNFIASNPDAIGVGVSNLSQAVWFGEYKFVDQPDFFCGCSLVLPETSVSRTFETAMESFDATTDEAIPAVAQHYMFHWDECGNINGALIVVSALDTVSATFKVKVHWMYIGNAIRY